MSLKILPVTLAMAAFAVAWSPWARADHQSADVVLGEWDKLSPQMYILQPSKDVRPLPASADEKARQQAGGDLSSTLNQAFSVLLIDQGQILFEGYAKGASAATRLHSQSMAKSMTSLAVGEALCAGKIASLDDTAASYAPALAGTAYGASTLRNLLRYTSGAQDPGGNGYAGIHNFRDFGGLLQHHVSLVDLMKKHGGSSRFKPGEKFIYNGLDSEALSVVVRAATGMTMAAWFDQTVWQKAGGEASAGWRQDREGNTIAQIGFFATPRDYARIALYVLDRLSGRSGDECIRSYLREASSPLVPKGYWNQAPSWGLSIHVGADGNPWFFGHGGQRVAIDVKKQRVIVTNSHQDIRGMETALMGVLARPYP
jgi:CubicO group peptidase (beta-lactamase class C family)